jgi:hypothetical protein
MCARDGQNKRNEREEQQDRQDFTVHLRRVIRDSVIALATQRFFSRATTRDTPPFRFTRDGPPGFVAGMRFL